MEYKFVKNLLDFYKLFLEYAKTLMDENHCTKYFVEKDNILFSNITNVRSLTTSPIICTSKIRECVRRNDLR